MTPRQRRISPGPAWAVLSEPPTSSPSTRASIHSDADLDLDVDMGDDESEHEPDPLAIRAPISKRKAPGDESGSARKPHKLPRLDLNGGTDAGRVSSGLGSPSTDRVAGPASRTQPAPLPSTQKNLKTPIALKHLEASRAESSSSGASTSDFPQVLSQRVQRANAKEKEREKEKTREQGVVASSRRGPAMTARKHTSQAKNVGKVTTARLLDDAQNSTRDESAAWTRIRPRWKPRRTNYDQEMARVRPLDMARQRGSDTIELTDLGDSARRRRLSQPSTANGPRPSILLNKDDPIIITSGSEDDRGLAIRPTQRRQSGSQRRNVNRKGAPPPANAVVISISESDEDVGAASTRPTTSTVATPSRIGPPPPPSQRAPAAPVPTTTSPIPESAPAPTSTQIPEDPPSGPQDTRRQDNEAPQHNSPPSYVPPPDDFDDAFGNMDFDTTGGDANANDASDGWDDLDIGPSLATLPGAVPSDPATASTSGRVPEEAEDVLEEDEMFDSYVNMDQLGTEVVQRTNEPTLPGGGDGAEERMAEDGVTNDLGPSSSGKEESRNADGNSRDRDVRMQDLEEGEVNPNDTPLPSRRSPDTPETGEIFSQTSRTEPQRENQSSRSIAPPHVSTQPVVAQPAPTSTVTALSSSASPHSSTSATSGPQPLERARTLVMPDISSYKGVRFKRPLPEARENPFFSRALNAAVCAGKTSENAGEKNGQRETEGCVSDAVSTPVDALSSVGEVQNKSRDADTQYVAAVPMPVPSRTLPEAVIPTPPLPPLQPTEAPITSDMQSTPIASQASLPAVEPDATANDNVPASTQPTTSSTHATPPPTAAQTLVPESSRPFIAPPRVPRPGAPLTLVEVLNELRREKRARNEAFESARKRNAVNVSSETTAPHGSTSQSPEAPSPQQPSTPAPSTRTFGKTPSLSDLRTLLARRNVGASQSARPTPTHTSNDDGDTHELVEPTTMQTPLMDGDDGALAEPETVPVPVTTEMPMSIDEDGHAPVEPVITPASATLQVPTSSDSGARALAEPVAMPAPATTQLPSLTDAKEQQSSEGTRTNKSVAWGTPTPTTASTSESSGSSSPNAKRRRLSSFVPFEAFISPVQSRDARTEKGKRVDEGRGKGKDVDPFISPVAARPTTASLLGLQKPEGRVSWHAPRASTSAAFETFIVRDSPKQMSGTRTDVDTGSRANDASSIRPYPQPPEQPRFSEGSESPSLPSVTSPVVPNPVPAPEPDVGMDKSTEDTNAMEVDKHGGDVDVSVESTHMEDGMRVGESEGNPTAQEEAEVDEADTLLELASVHLSQPEAGVDERNTLGEMDVVDELADSSGTVASEKRLVGEPEREAGRAMVIDTPAEDLETRGETVRQTALDNAPSHPTVTEVNEPAEDDDMLALENNVASTAAVATEVEQDVLVEDLSHTTTPELILPEGDIVLLAEPPSSSTDADQEVAYDNSHQRRRSGGEDSIDECDALLTVPAGCESDSEAIPAGSFLSSKTASSTSLAPPRPDSRLSRSGSKEKTFARATSSADPLDLLRHPTPVSEPATDGSASKENTVDYRVVTWASHVAEQRKQPPEYKRAKNLPHSLQDYMNMLPASFRNSDVGRRIFEAHIQESMIGEPDAPLIEIFDNDIGDEVTPSWEFHYTNEMWYAEGVPPPDVQHLQSCGCVGRCDPKSGKCACARRQLEWVQPYIDGEIIPPTWPGSPFVYDSRGMLQRLESPIFECNRFCQCDEDCPNRVVQNGRKWPVHIVRTLHKGWGLFAGNKKIPKGSYIGIYAGEYITEQEGETRGRYYDLYGRTYLFSVDFHHLKMGMEDPEDWENLYVVDAYHAGNITRFLNHSCDPNCKIFACYIDDADVNKPLLAVFTTREVEPWEELCFSYYGDIDEKREEIEAARDAGKAREHAVYAQCRCEADNCIGRLFS